MSAVVGAACSAVFLVAAVAVGWDWLRDRRRADLGDVLAGRIAAHPVPVEDIYDGLGLYVDTLTGGHDRFPNMSDEVRDVCTTYLEQSWVLPNAERAS